MRIGKWMGVAGGLVGGVVAATWVTAQDVDSQAGATAAPATTQAAPEATTQPAEAGAAQADISPEARVEIEALSKAYTSLKSLDIEGSVTGDFDVAGRTQNETRNFTGGYAQPNMFRHEVKDEMTVGSTGSNIYMYQPVENVFAQLQAPPAGTSFAMFPQPLPQILQVQNPSLALALTVDPAQELSQGVESVKKLDDTQIDGKAHPTLVIDPQGPGGKITWMIDPQTHLLRRVQYDLSELLLAQGAPDVKKAQITVDYTRSASGHEFAEGAFQWTPPQGARDAVKQQEEQIRQMREQLQQMQEQGGGEGGGPDGLTPPGPTPGPQN